MPWRYQPVYTEEPGGDLAFGLCVVHFESDSDLLKKWTDPFLCVVGNDASDLQGELTRMLMDAWCWIPVEYKTLRVGMTFEKAISMEDRLGIAEIIETAVDECRSKSFKVRQ